MFLAQKKRELITIDSHVLSVTSCKVSSQFLIVFSVAFGAFLMKRRDGVLCVLFIIRQGVAKS